MDFISPELILSFITLTILEIVLGIDNLIFISLITGKLPKENRAKVRVLGLSLALVIRILMLFSLSWVITLTEPLFFLGSLGFSFKNLLLLAGGVFLVLKSGSEIYHDVSGSSDSDDGVNGKSSLKITFAGAIVQIIAIDFVFSFDSVITAVAMTDNLYIIVAAVVISMIVMLLSSESISGFLAKYPSLKIIALALIFLVGIILLAGGFNIHIPKTYLYFSLFFTLSVEVLNIIAKKKSESNCKKV